VASGGGSFFALFPPMVPIDGLTTAAVAFASKSSRLAIKVALVIWVVAAVVWWAADWPMWWGPEPSIGLVVYAVLGAAMVQARFMLSARAGGADL
jgi:hypothetical protein